MGSQSFTGADGATLPVWLERVMTAMDVWLGDVKSLLIMGSRILYVG